MGAEPQANVHVGNPACISVLVVGGGQWVADSEHALLGLFNTFMISRN